MVASYPANRGGITDNNLFFVAPCIRARHAGGRIGFGVSPSTNGHYEAAGGASTAGVYLNSSRRRIRTRQEDDGLRWWKTRDANVSGKTPPSSTAEAGPISRNSGGTSESRIVTVAETGMKIAEGFAFEPGRGYHGGII
jgi:hypothetical protein